MYYCYKKITNSVLLAAVNIQNPFNYYCFNQFENFDWINRRKDRTKIHLMFMDTCAWNIKPFEIEIGEKLHLSLI